MARRSNLSSESFAAPPREPAAATQASRLARLAAGITIPLLPDGSRARAYVTVTASGPDHAPTAPCHHVDEYRVVFGLDYGRRDSAPVGPAFRRAAEACALARLLNRQPGAQLDAEATLGARSKVFHADLPPTDTAEPPAPPPAWPEQAQAARCEVCAACGEPLPSGRADRRYCSPRCRQAGRRAGLRVHRLVTFTRADQMDHPEPSGAPTPAVAGDRASPEAIRGRVTRRSARSFATRCPGSRPSPPPARSTGPGATHEGTARSIPSRPSPAH